ncbi:hypothetical protein U2F10_24210 [Leptothoe sp. EHU-05/26/07-4]
MTTTVMTRPAESAVKQRSCQALFPVGEDCGNGALKLATSLGESRLDSYIVYTKERLSLGLTAGYVEYLEGDRDDLIGKQWIGGINAYYHAPNAVLRVTDDRYGKVDLGLQLLLSAVSLMPHRDEWHLSIASSVHDGPVLGKGVKAAKEGRHQVRFNNRDTVVNIEVCAVLEEGTGAVIHYQKQADFTNAIVYDLGNGTLIYSHFIGLAMSDRGYSDGGGVESLIDAIACNPIVREKLLKEGDRHLIRAGIEATKFTYGTQYPGWHFADAYKQALPAWVNTVLKPLLRKAETATDSATALIAIGGGACLPGIVKLLSKRNIKVLPDPQWANVRGLYAYARNYVAKQEVK